MYKLSNGNEVFHLVERNDRAKYFKFVRFDLWFRFKLLSTQRILKCNIIRGRGSSTRAVQTTAECPTLNYLLNASFTANLSSFSITAPSNPLNCLIPPSNNGSTPPTSDNSACIQSSSTAPRFPSPKMTAFWTTDGSKTIFLVLTHSCFSHTDLLSFLKCDLNASSEKAAPELSALTVAFEAQSLAYR